MKVLAESFFHKHVLERKFRDTLVLNLPLLEIESLCRNDESKAEDPFSNCCLLNLSNNHIDEGCFNSIWVDFPSCWWINLSNNHISSLSSVVFPLAISLLDLSSNPLSISELGHLSLCHILRFHLSLESVPSINAALDRTWNALLSINHHMHLVWTFNNHFISHFDRTFVLENFPPESTYHEEIKQSQQGSWSSLAINMRQTTVINATHHLERIDHVSDTVRLDILFEDYMHECLVWNNFCHAVSVCKTVTNKHLKKKPMVSNVNAILFAPHRQRLDLSVLLTVRLMYSIPDPLFHDALIILLGEYISAADVESLLNLPPFALTALISLIRRVSFLENQDICQGQMSRLQVLGIDPTLKPQYSPFFIPTFDSSESFQFLRDAQRYIKFRFQTTEDDVHHNKLIPFSELEEEIMKQLPDIPTKWCGFANVFQTEKDAKLLRWVPFACRHAIFILNKAPSCPPLNGVCRNAKDQEFYLEMLPLLKAANMSLVDLDIVTMSPQVDGRAITNLSRTANLSGAVDIHNVNNKISSHRRRLEQAMKLLQGKVLPFGMGLPNASISSLRWKANEEEIARPYEKPWQANTHFATSDNDGKTTENNDENYQGTQPIEGASAVGSSFFMTGDVVMQQFDSLGKQSPVHNAASSRNRSKNYLNNYDNPLANRPSPIIMETGKEVYKLDENYLQLSVSSSSSSYRPLSPAKNSNDINSSSGINKGPSYVVQDVNLDFSKPPSRAITPGTWTVNRPPSSSQYTHENRSGSVNIPLRTPFTTIFPAMPTNFEEMKQAVTQGGVLESDSYDFNAGINSGAEIIPTHELFPPEFHPHSRAPSINTFNSKINQVLSVMSATSPGSSALSRPLSVYDNNTRQSSAKPQMKQSNILDSFTEGKNETDANSNVILGSWNDPALLLDGEDNNVQMGDGTSVKSLVSISLPSVDGARGMSNVMSRGNKSGGTSPIAADKSEWDNCDNVAMFNQPTSALVQNQMELAINQSEITMYPRLPLSSSPNKSLHTVNVFSADHMWNPQFVVAPTVAIDSFNKHFQLFQYHSNDKNPASFQYQYWKELNQPPVIMLPSAGNNPTLDPQLLTRSSSPPRTVFLHSLEYPPSLIVKSPPRSPRQQSSSKPASPINSIQVINLSAQQSEDNANCQLSVDQTELDKDGNVIYDDELGSALKPYSSNNISNNDRKPTLEEIQVATARSLTLSDATPSVRGLTASLSGDFGQPIPISAMNTPFSAVSAYPTGTLPIKKFFKETTAGTRIAPSAFKVDAAEIQQAREELLRDMGTLRNTRELQSFNDHIHSLRMSSDGHIFKVPTTSNPSETSNDNNNAIVADCSVSEVTSQVGLDMTMINDMLLTQRPKLSLLVKPLGLENQHKPANQYIKQNNHNEMVFFTEAPGQYAEEGNKQEDNEDARLAEEEAYYNQYRSAYQSHESFNSGDPNSLVTSDVTYGDGDAPSFQIAGYDFPTGGANMNNNNDFYFVDNGIIANVAGEGEIGVVKTPSQRIREEARANRTLLGMNVMHRDLSHKEIPPSLLHDTIRLIRTVAEDKAKTKETMDALENNIFSEETYIDQVNSQPTVSGAKISSSFYPVYPKVVYRVSAEDALAAVYHQQLHSSSPNKSPSKTINIDTDNIKHQLPLSPKHAFASSSRPTSFSQNHTHQQVGHSINAMRPITSALFQNSTLTPADSLSVASLSQHSLLMKPDAEENANDMIDNRYVDTEHLIAAQNVQVLQQSHHFKDILGNNKNVVKATANNKITQLLSSSGPGAMLDSHMNYLGPYNHAQNHSMGDRSYGEEENEYETADMINMNDNVVRKTKAMSFQDSIAYSSAPGGPSSVQTNSFSEVVDGLRGSIVEGDFVAPPPEIVLEHSQASHSGLSPYNDNHQKASSSSSVAVLSLNLKAQQEIKTSNIDDVDTFSVASAASATSVASSHSSGLNEQGSHLIYRAYSAQMTSVNSHNGYHSNTNSDYGHYDATNDVAIVGENMPILHSPHRDSSHKVNNNSDNSDKVSSVTIRRSNSPNFQQHLKKVIISKASQRDDAQNNTSAATNIQPATMTSLISGGMSQTSQASGMLMNLSLSNGSLHSFIGGSDGIALSTNRDHNFSASLNGLPNNSFKNSRTEKQKSNASLMLGSQSSSSPSLMILAPKSAEALMLIQEKQKRKSMKNKLQKSIVQSQSTKVFPTNPSDNVVPRPSSGQLLPPLKHYPPLNNANDNTTHSQHIDVVKPHRRLRSISGRENPQTHHIWVGKQAYKAATAKLTIDPAFGGATHAAYNKRLQEQRHWQQTLQFQSSSSSPQSPVDVAADANRPLSSEKGKGRPVMTMADMLPQSH